MTPTQSVGVCTRFVQPCRDRQRVVAHVAEADAAYFARHPDRAARLRLFVPGEIPFDLDVRYMLILRIGDGYVRIPLGDEQAARFVALRPSFTSRDEVAA